MKDTIADISIELSAPALREWTHLVEHVLRGVAHSLNNRASAVVAVLELSSDPKDGWSAATSILASERERVEELVAVVRAIGAPVSRADAFIPADAALEAQRVLAMHSGLQGRSITFEAGSAPPTRVPRWMLVRALIGLAASASVREVHSPVRVTLTDENEWLVARVHGTRSSLSDQSPLASELATAIGGEVLRDALGFRVPTLTALRRREGH